MKTVVIKKITVCGLAASFNGLAQVWSRVFCGGGGQCGRLFANLCVSFLVNGLLKASSFSRAAQGQQFFYRLVYYRLSSSVNNGN